MLTEVIEGFRLSPQQEHLWTLQQDAQSQIYRTQCAILIEGSLDFEALQVALQTIAQNHEIIRTSFQRLPGMSIPVQVITKNQNVLIKQYDISDCNPHEQAIKIETVFQEISSKITLGQEKFLNTALVTLSTKRHLFLINLPALLADSLTINNFVRELSLAYLGKEISEEAIQYADFAEWQNELLAADETVIGREYWQQQDLSLMFHIKLPGDKNQATIAEFQSEFISAKLAPNVFTQLEKLAQACNISVDVFLLACWQLLVWRLTKQSNIIIGTAFTGRNYPELTNALGLFARYLPVGSHLEDNLNFRQVLDQVNESYSKVAQWQDCFSWQLFEDIQDLTFCPICFDFEEPAIKYSESDVSFSLDQKFSCVDRFNIKLTCKCKDSSVITEFHYDSYQFATADVERLLDQFHTLVASVLTSPDTAISKLEILSDRAKYQLLVEFNQTQTDYPIDTCIHHLYAAQAQLTPDNIAVTFENEQLTYQQLNQRANQLARYLELQGITPNTLVGICVERSLDMIVGILGILKAAAAYVPIDPTYPPERIAWILQNSQAKVLLTQQPLVAKLPPHQAQIICLDTDWKIIAQHSQENLEIATTPNDLAYIIYTSGSTGKPKGVQIAHRNLVHSTNARIAYYQQPVSRFLLLSSFAFDSSVAGIFWTLCCGGTLVLPQEGLQREIPQLIDLIAQYQISHLLSLPSLYALILEQAKLEKLTSLKTIIVAGEACSSELVKLHFQQLPTSSLFNEYGPTEGTVWSSVYHCQSPDITRVPIGRPIANTQIYILDTQLQPVPTGVPGEVYISGDGLALGYWQQPELTAERFIFNSFNKEVEKRLYKTGDLAQFLPDGNIHFIGRIDQQVKIRGFRIELGEIEFALSQHPEVKEAIAIVREDEPGKQRLVAYILSKSSNTPKDLRQFLQAYLPDYMLPSAFVVLVEFPLSPNGKVDCRALLAPEELSNQRENFVLPRTPVEEILAGIWAEVLGVGRVGIHDNFFELGGHSILATQIVSRIRNTFQVELMLRSLFESPTVAGLGTKIEALLRDNQQLQALPLQAIQRQAEIPLSFAQQRLWFFYQLEPESPAYNIAGAIKVQGSLDVEALNRSINEIVRRHEVLRTQLTAVDGKAIQIILPGLSLPLPIVDVDSETPLNTLIAEEAQRPFDLEREPLLRVRLLRLAAEEHILQFTMHHIVSDGWSAGVLVRELATLYEAFAQNQPSPLPELPIQYADYGLWQREWLQGQLQTQLDYWKQQLGGELPVLALPSDRPRPTVQSFAGDEYAVTLPKELTQELKNLSQKTGVTLFMTLLAAFQTLLYRYSGQEDILVGSPIANRNQSELESLIGFFVNTLVLRTDLSGNPTFQELLGRVREVTLGAYAHQDVPFEKLVEELQPERDLSYAPLFQVMFVLQNAPMQKLELPSLSLETLEVKRGTTNFDLTLSLEELEEGLRFNLEYNTDLFDAETITRLLENFQTLLRGIVSNPQQHLLNLPLLSEAEQQKLQDWSQTPSKHQPVDLCIHRLFEQQVKRTPDKIAVVFEDVTVTYQELNQRANQLAGYLHLLGVGPETLVGLCVERSIEMIVGILGILKAGGAYLPLDPTYPQERLTFMLADAGVSILVTQHQLLEQLPTFTGSVVCLDENSADIQQQSQDNQNIQITSDNLAYVIYTSGSTGTPKGVLVNHSNVVRLFTATEEWFHFSEKDVWTLFHSSAFDFSVWEIWGALLYGGRLVVVPYSITRSPQDFYNLLCVQQVTVLNQTPSAFRQLIRVVEQCRQTLALRLVIFGGEALDITSLKPWFDHYGDQLPQLVNMYGITETTVHVTYRPLSKADLRLTNSIIGYPIPDLQVYLLNQQRQPVPIGVPGEIYVGGGGVTRGYLQRPELTAERFIPHPVSSSRLYKTGDLARYLPNGELEYLGRIDHQVKIRGFRIELGEIEAVLNQHPQLQETVVLVGEEQIGRKLLIVYVVPNPEFRNSSDLIDKLRNWVQDKLPDYMVPAVFVLLDTIPLTSNGKVDRQALLACEPHFENRSTFISAQTKTEKLLAQIWAELLSLEEVSINDNFFALGGDSILSLQVIARANQAGLQITPKQLFQNQTIAQLAKVVKVDTNISAAQGLVTGTYPLTPIQHWFFAQNLQEPNHYNQAVLLEVQPGIDPEVLEKAVQHLLQHHDVLRSHFVQQSVMIAESQKVSVEIVNLSTLSAEQQSVTITNICNELQASLNISTEQVFKVALLNLGDSQRLFVVIHHLVIDGVSWRILLEDLQAVYAQINASEPIKLPPKTTSFQQWAYRLQEYAQLPDLQKELDYWLQIASQPCWQLPVDYPSGDNTISSVDRVTVTLSEAETKALLTEVSAAYKTQINDVLLTALVQAFAQWTGQNQLLFNLEGHGREELFSDVNLSRTVGWFTTLYPVILSLEEATNPGAALKRVKEQLRQIPNRGINYGVLRYLCKDVGIKTSHAEVSFNYLGQFDQVFTASSLFKLAPESSGIDQSQRNHRPHLLEINGSITAGQLQLQWQYSQNIHKQSTIAKLAQAFMEALRSIIVHCQSPDTVGFTPSDFPLAQLTQAELDAALKQISF